MTGTRGTIESRFWSKVDKSGDCWIWTAGMVRGYGVLSVGGRNGHMELAHRISYEIHYGDLSPDALVLHSCDTPACVNPAHLRAGTHAENVLDMCVRERVNTTKLTADQVQEMRIELRGGASHRELATKYGVSKSNVSMINRRETWKHVA